MKIKIAITFIFLTAIIIGCTKQKEEHLDHMYLEESKLLVTSDAHQTPVDIQKNGDIIVGNIKYYLFKKISDTKAIYRENNDKTKNICLSVRNGELWKHEFGERLFKDCLPIMAENLFKLRICIGKALNTDNAPTIPTSRFAMLKDPEYKFSRDSEDISAFLDNVPLGVSMTYLIDMVNQRVLTHSESNRVDKKNQKIIRRETTINLLGEVIKTVLKEYEIYAVLDNRTCIFIHSTTSGDGTVRLSYRLCIFADNRMYISKLHAVSLNESPFTVPPDLFDINENSKILQYVE